MATLLDSTLCFARKSCGETRRRGRLQASSCELVRRGDEPVMLASGASARIKGMRTYREGFNGQRGSSGRQAPNSVKRWWDR
jgi:hypothetical protein